MGSHQICPACSKEQQFVFQKGDFRYHRCRSCRSLSSYPLPSDEEINAHYAQAFKDGNYRLGQEFMRDYMHVYRGMVSKLTRVMHRDGLRIHGATVLDIGCFTGELLDLLSEHGADVYGLELQNEAVNIANRKLPGRVLKADVFSDIFPSKKFDAVVLSGVIEHVMHPAKLLRRAMEFMRPGGVIMLQTPNSSSWMSWMLGKYWPPCAPVEHIHLFSKKGLERMLHDVGFGTITFSPHWKTLPIDYVYNNFENFGQEFHRILRPVHRLLPHRLLRTRLPFYIGEMIVFARKPRRGSSY